MPPNASKMLSPAELQKLEHAFATDPSSEAYKPLAEAYLAMSRFMEAMVVCKKGVKAHPTLPDPRVLLARVYAEQGKDKKALEEIAGALQTAPADKSALRLAGALQLKVGEAAIGKENLLKAYDLDPKDEETLALMSQHQVAAPVVVVPPPPPSPAPAPRASADRARPRGASASRLSPAGSGSGRMPQALIQTEDRVPAPIARALAAAGGTSPGPRPSQPRRERPAADDRDEPPSGTTDVSGVSDLSDVSSEYGAGRPEKKSSLSRLVFFLLIFLVPVVAGAYFGIGQWRARVSREVKKALQQAGDELRHDTFDSYKKACAEGEAALDLDPGNAVAHSYLAYAYTVRWGEHERDDTMKGRAEENLKEAREKKEAPTYLYAAEALFKYYSGKGAEGLKALDERVQEAESQNKRASLLYLTQGILQMAQGDLERAKEALDKAQGVSPDDPRIYVALGNLHRRRGNDAAALQAFNSALRFTRNSHPEGLLGTALLILDQENPAGGYVTASKYLKTLLDFDPPPSPRQLAQAHFVRALLVSRASTDIPRYSSKDFQKQLEDGTGVPTDAAKVKSEVKREEDEGSNLDRANPDLHLIRAKRFFWEEKYDEAAVEVQKAIDQNGSAANYHVELAKVLMKKEGGDAQAEASLRKALSLVPNSPKLLAMLGQVLYRQKKVDEARDTLERAAADTKTRNPEARYLLGKIYRDDKKDFDRAIRLFEKAAQEYTSDPLMAATAYNAEGQALEAKGEKDKARVAYEKALNAEKEYDEPYCNYARLLSKLGDAKDKDRIKGAATEYLKLNPKGDCAPDMQRIVAPPAPPP